MRICTCNKVQSCMIVHYSILLQQIIRQYYSTTTTQHNTSQYNTIQYNTIVDYFPIQKSLKTTSNISSIPTLPVILPTCLMEVLSSSAAISKDLFASAVLQVRSVYKQ